MDEETPARSRGASCWLWAAGAVGALVVSLALLLILMPGYITSRSQGQLAACKGNLKNLGTALEMYATDSEGRYPASTADLVPTYLKELPRCSASGEYWRTPLGTITWKQPVDTYSATYVSASNPDAYTVWCAGSHHLEAYGSLPDYPQYNSRTGLVER